MARSVRWHDSTVQDATATDLAVAVFRLATGRYGVLLEDVIEVQRMVAVTPLPGAPAVVEGVIDVRGTPVPVLDVRRRFDLPPSDVHPGQHLLLARAGERTVALRVDQVLELAELPSERITADPDSLPGTTHVAGLATDDEGLILLHDLATFLSLDEAAQIDDALQGRDAS